MKPPKTLSLALFASFLRGNDGAPHLRRRATTTTGLLLSYGQILSGDSHLKACMELPPEAYNQIQKDVILGDCSARSGWRFDPKGRIHSQWNDEYCVQVHSHEGAHLQLVPCDDDNSQQRFVYHNHGEAIRPRNNQELCVTWRGNHADIGQDTLVVKSCDKVEFQRHWIGQFPRASDEEETSSQEGSV